MKTKKLNRGLVLGAALLVGLAGFVTFDYFNFKSNKGEIKTAVENYINDCAKASITEDGDCREAVKKVVDDNWGYNAFYSQSFVSHYITASEIKSNCDYLTDKDMKKGHITECTASISDVKVSKAGPNLAQAEVEYSIKFKGVGAAHLLTMNSIENVIYASNNENHGDSADLNLDSFKDLEYSGYVNYGKTATFYLEYKGGDWKIVGAEGYAEEFKLTNADGAEIDLEKYAKGDKTPDEPKADDKESKGKKPVAVKLPDGTVIDIPEGEELPADIKELPAGTEMIYEDDKDNGSQSDDSSSKDKDDSSSGEKEVQDLDALDASEPDPKDSSSDSSSSPEDEEREKAYTVIADTGEPHYYDPDTGEELLVRSQLKTGILNRGWR